MAAKETWNSILPGPPSRNNGGSADLSTSGLFAFASGSNIAILDPHTMQLISVIPFPPPSSTSLSPFVTSLRWIPQPLRRDLLTHEPSSSHLVLAVGDRQGRIALIDFLRRSVLLWFDVPFSSSKNGVQDLCWLQARSESWIIAAVVGSSTVLLFSASSGHCFWKYEYVREFVSCVRCDPFDSRHFCVVGFKGFMLSAVVVDESENGVVVKEIQIKTDLSELQKLERDASAGISSSSNSSSSSPALVVFPLYMAKIAFSPVWKHVLFLAFPRELVVFDLDYERSLYVAYLPRGCGKFYDVLPDSRGELLHCVHLDGRLSTWKRKHGEQVYVVCSIEELIPSSGTTAAPPSLLSVAMSHFDPIFETISKSYPNVCTPDLDFSIPLDGSEHISISKTRFISVSDDGKIWNWILTAKWADNISNNITDTHMSFDSENGVVQDAHAIAVPIPINEPVGEGTELPEITGITECLSSKLTESELEASFKVKLVGQLQLLSSTLTMLAVPTPSMTAILARGGNDMAVPVPLVALGNQIGTIDVVDVSATAVASCYSVHTSMVRGLRFLGNSRLVSFSYSKVNEKIGGYNNMLVVTCLRSGLHRTFRTLRKPERAPLRALRASSSGRYLVILFRDAPAEIWAMTKTPIMLRSLALPFTVVEWSLPVCRKTGQQQPTLPRDHTTTAQKDSYSSPLKPSEDQKAVSSDESQDCSESFAFALVNGALGVFEVNGRRIRDSRPKWPSSSFVSSDGMVTAMAFRAPHVVMGDRSGNMRWWDITTGHSSAFNTRRDGIRRIKFAPVVFGDQSRGRIAVLFADNTFSIFDLDSQDPLANSLLQPQFPGTLVLELDWLPLRTDKDDPLVLCIAGADSSFRLIEINISNKKIRNGILPRAMGERFRPVPLCLPVLLPTPHALALRMVLQHGIESSWLISSIAYLEKNQIQHESVTPHCRDLRSYIIGKQYVGDSAVTEMLLKVLEPYQKDGGVLDDEWAHLYSTLVHKGCAARFAFAAAVFGESKEALFWAQLPHALMHLKNCLVKRSTQKTSVSSSVMNLSDSVLLNRITSKGRSSPLGIGKHPLGHGRLKTMAFEQGELWETANQRITWHEKLEDDADVQNRVHELVSVGSLEAAVSLLLSTSPESSFFYTNALRAVALSSTVSRSLLELAVKVVAANMVRTDELLCGIHLLCAVGRYQEACSQLQDVGRWTDAATLASTYLKGSDYSRVLHRWAIHLLHEEHDMWRALILFVAAGSLGDALSALREAQQPDTAAMFVAACRELHLVIVQGLDREEAELFTLPGLTSDTDDVVAVFEYYQHYQRKIVHLCMDTLPYFH